MKNIPADAVNGGKNNIADGISVASRRTEKDTIRPSNPVLVVVRKLIR